MEVLILVAAGIVVGICSGLFGIGGGTIIVPLMFLLLEHNLIPATASPDNIGQQVIFTSLCVVIFTSAVSSFSHWKRGATSFDKLKLLAGGLLFGSILGSLTLISINEHLIKWILGIFFLLMAYSYSVKKSIFHPISKKISQLPLALVGGVIGWLSVILGIAGGIFNVGILNLNGLSMKKAVGTSAAAGLIISLSSVISAMLISSYNGSPVFQYIHIPFFLSIFIVAGLSSNIGVRIAHSLSDAKIKTAFAVYLCLIAGYFLINNFRELYT